MAKKSSPDDAGAEKEVAHAYREAADVKAAFMQFFAQSCVGC